MAGEITKTVWRNGQREKDSYDLASSTVLTSATDLYDVVLAEFALLNMTDANIPGNATMAGLATSISTTADNDGLLV
jgi:hypothetical protein